jgi:hypothetical protein
MPRAMQGQYYTDLVLASGKSSGLLSPLGLASGLLPGLCSKNWYCGVRPTGLRNFAFKVHEPVRIEIQIIYILLAALQEITVLLLF